MINKIVMVGMSGSGKSVVGEKLAEILEMHYVDVDEMVEYEFDKIENLFQQFQEVGYRDYEKRVVKNISSYLNAVVSTGAGSVIDSESREDLKCDAIVIYLATSLSNIEKRTQNVRCIVDAGKPIKMLKKQREKIYKDMCHLKISTNKKTVDQVVDEIVKKLNVYVDKSLKDTK